MSDLVEWLTKILDEDEREAGYDKYRDDAWWMLGPFDADFVLADIAAKRAIIARHAAVRLSGDTCCAVCIKPEWPCATLHDMATAYADRPGYDEGWRP